MLFWGSADFAGGYAVRRANAFLFTAVAHGCGGIFVLLVALLTHSSFPSRSGAAWALAAGLLGGLTVVFFYRALAAGKMGLTAPLAAVLGAAIPAGIGIATEGLPGIAPLLGFLLAGTGIWLIARPEDGVRPDGFGLAVFSGVGFAGFFLCIRQAGSGSALWIAALSRASAFIVTGAVVLLRREVHAQLPKLNLAIVTGCLDVSGTILFIRAAQSGRLDTVVVVSSLYPAVTVLLASVILRERFTRWKAIGMFVALLAVPMIALQ
jgi:drug/metabolite transporter (DMT)-like permease